MLVTNAIPNCACALMTRRPRASLLTIMHPAHQSSFTHPPQSIAHQTTYFPDLPHQPWMAGSPLCTPCACSTDHLARRRKASTLTPNFGKVEFGRSSGVRGTNGTLVEQVVSCPPKFGVSERVCLTPSLDKVEFGRSTRVRGTNATSLKHVVSCQPEFGVLIRVCGIPNFGKVDFGTSSRVRGNRKKFAAMILPSPCQQRNLALGWVG